MRITVILVESAYEVCKPLMTSPDVRLFFCYQYGKDEVRHGQHTFNAKYAGEASEFHKRSGWGNWLKLNTRDVSRSFDSSGNIRIGNDDAKYDDVME